MLNVYAPEAFFYRQFFNSKKVKIIDYIRDTKGEMKHVSWPTKKQAFAFTAIVIVLSLIVAFFLGFLDYVFSFLLELIIA